MVKKYNIIIIILAVFIVLTLLYIFLFSSNNIKEIKLDKSEIEIYVGKTAKLTPTIIPDDAEDKSIIWKSENDSIVKVNENGLILGIKDGETKIIVSSIDEKVSTSCKVKVLPIDVEEIELLESKLTLTIGEKGSIISTIVPNNATHKELSYESSDISIAKVNENGVIEAIKEGQVIVTVKSINGKTATCEVKVVPNVSSITLNKTNLEIKITKSEQLVASVSPSSASGAAITWSSSNTSVATVNKNGLVNGVSIGEAVITAESGNGIKATCKVVVTPKTVEVESVSLNKTNMTISKNQSDTLIATVSPSNATNKEVTWSSSNTTIATVSNGKITPKKTGKVVITAKANNGKLATATITIVSSTYQKRAIFFGDSITMGKYGHYSWANYIGEKYDLKSSINAGISGGVVSTFRGEYWIVNEVKKYRNQKVDYVIMHGGINDIALSVLRGESLGSYKANDFSGKYDTSSFVGGLETYLYTVKKQWPNAKLGYIINYKTPHDSTVIQKDNEFYSTLIKVLKKWNISYINLFSGKASNGKKYSDILKVNTNTYIEDGVHLNVAGYKVISPYIYEWMSNL